MNILIYYIIFFILNMDKDESLDDITIVSENK